LVSNSVLNIVEPGDYYDHGVSMNPDYVRSGENAEFNPRVVDRVKKAFPSYVDEIDQLFATRTHQIANLTFSTIGTLRGLDAPSLVAHEFTHAMRQVADTFAPLGDNIDNVEQLVDNYEEFVTKVDTSFYDFSSEGMKLKEQNLLKVGEEALDISTYSRRIENELFNLLSGHAAEEARANTGANLLTRMAFGKESITHVDDVYDALGGFQGYANTDHHIETLLRKHPVFGDRMVAEGDRGLVLRKPIEEFPEILEKFGKTKKEISLRVDMRLNAEYLGQLGELGGGYSTGTKGIESALDRNVEGVFNRAYSIDQDFEKAYGYIMEYGDMLTSVSQEARNVSTVSISTMPEFGQSVRTKDITRCK